MNPDLTKITENFLEVMKNNEGVIGAWSFGSAARDMSDEYSDADIVFLINGSKFKKTEKKLETLILQICDDILICYEEEFNGESIINNGYLIKKDDNIFQLDIFLLNNDRKDDFICKIHYTDLSEKDILFDPYGQIKILCESCPHGCFRNGNPNEFITTYLYHLYISAKYIARKDYFKLHYLMRTLFDAHASLLLSFYDNIKWGGEANKLNFIPKEKQEHLKNYFCCTDFRVNKSNLLKGIEYFKTDIEELSIDTKKHIDNLNKIKNYWLRIVTI